MENPILKYQKNASKDKNKIIIPKAFIDKHGYSYYMEIYEDKIVLIPIKKQEK